MKPADAKGRIAMDQMIPYRKLSKKERKKLDAKKRVTWGFSPVTRKKGNAKAYDRKKAKRWKEELQPLCFFVC